MPQLENLHAAMKTQCNNINNNKKGMKKKRSQVGSTGSTRFLLLFPSCAFPSVKPNEGASKGLTCKGWVFSTGLRLLALPLVFIALFCRPLSWLQVWEKGGKKKRKKARKQQPPGLVVMTLSLEDDLGPPCPSLNVDANWSRSYDQNMQMCFWLSKTVDCTC